MWGHVKKRDIASGDFKFGERLRMAQILRDQDKPHIERIKDIIECLHGFRPSTARAAIMAEYAIDVAETFVKWIEREQNECTVPPTPEATRAGVSEMTKNIGEMGSVVDLAERFHLLPFARVYELPYLDVFAIWKADAETAKFERRLRAVYEADAKSKNKKR